MPNKTAAIVSILALGQAIAIVSLPVGSASAATPATHVGAIARGSVESAGRPMDDARVVLYAWPANSVLARLRPGQRVPTTVVGAATTDPSGRYVISAAQAGLRPDAAPDGTVNLELVALAPGRFASYSFSRTLGQVARGAISLPAASALVAAKVRPAAVASFARTTAGEAPTAASSSGAAKPAAVVCGWVAIKNYAPVWTVVGATFDTTDDVTQHFTYNYGEQSSLGVGLSGSGTGGSFSQSGTVTVSSTATEDFPPSTGAIDTRYETQFVNTEYGYTCGAGYMTWETRATSFAGGAQGVSTGYPTANYCVYQEKGSTFTEDTSAAYTFGAGFYLSAIALNLTAQTGYNSGASISYYFGIAHYLCGTADYPGGTPRELVAGKV
jgi:hypothetical protein